MEHPLDHHRIRNLAASLREHMIGARLAFRWRRRRIRRKVSVALEKPLMLLDGVLLRVGRRAPTDLDSESGRTTETALRNVHINERIAPTIEDARERGAPEKELWAAVQTATDKSGGLVANLMLLNAPSMLRQHRVLNRAFRRRMRGVWGPALDEFYAIYVAVEEVGSGVQIVHGAGSDALLDALLGLHARASLLLAEIHGLMSLGYVNAATGRSRTLYETAVIATILSDYGREPGYEDLADRFVVHPVVDMLRDMNQEQAEGLPVDQNELGSIQRDVDDLVKRYGRIFKKDFGWAHPLFPNQDAQRGRIGFADLDNLCRADVLDRSDYRAGNHQVHSSPWSLVLHEQEFRGRTSRLTGPTNVGFTNPARIALVAGLETTSALVHGLDPGPDLMDLVAVSAIDHLAARCLKEFDEAQRFIDERETMLRSTARNRD